MKKMKSYIIPLFFIIACCSKNTEIKIEDIGKVYKSSMIKLAVIVNNHPEASTIIDKVKKLKEDTIQKMVKIGKKFENLSKAEKNKLTSKLWRLMGNAQKDKKFSESWKIMNKSQMYYSSKKEYELSKLISSFNIITQYAQFDLLKEQLPDEAKRLGIK